MKSSSKTGASHRSCPAATRRFLPAASAIAVAALLASCGSGDDEKATAGADIETLQAEAGDALEQAKKLGLEKLAADEFGRAKKQIDDADAAAEAGDQKKAATKYKSAVKSLARLVEEQKQLGEDRAKVASGEKAAAVEAKKKADAAKAQTNAAAMYAEASEALKKGESLLESAKAKKTLLEAKQSLSRSRDLFEQAARVAGENEIDRKRFDEEKAALAELKEKAKKAGAEEKAATEWLQAEQLERDAQSQFDRGEFRAAVEQMKQTAIAYQNAIRRVTEAANYAEMLAKGEAEAKEYEKKQAAEEEKRRAEEAAARAVREKELAEKAARRRTVAGKDGKKGASASIVPFEEFDPEKYTQVLDDEDTQFLNDNLTKLTKSQVLEYDPTTGFVRLNYIVGRDVEKDVEPVLLQNKEYLTFEDPLLKGTKAKTREEAEATSAYSFSGNTAGIITFPVPFRYYVKVEYDMFIQTMNSSSSFSTILMCDAKKRTGYMSDWAKLGTMAGWRFKPVKLSPKAEYNGSADIWHIKYRGFPYLFEYKWLPGAEGKKATGVFLFDHDAGQSGSVVNKLSSTAYTRGQIGFSWSGVKFTIRNFMITGILDKEAAVAKLRELTGIKKSDAAAEKTGKTTTKKTTETARKPDTKKAAGGGNGTEKDGTEKTGEDGAKKGGDFDF
jgi:hypothetical protein